MNSSRKLPPIPPASARSEPSIAIVRLRLGSFDWLISDKCQRVTWLNRLEQPWQLFERPAEQLKRVVVPGREVVRVAINDAKFSDLVVKRFAPRTLLETLKWSWRASPAFRAFELARHIQALGLMTASPVAAGERRVCGLLRESFLLTSYIPNATPIYLVNAGCAERRRRVRIVRDVARVYATLHDAGFYHCDPNQTNFLVVPESEGRESVVLIDLDGLRWQSRMSLADAAKDLQRLLLRCSVTRRERAWFLVAYSRLRKVRVDARLLVKRIGLPPAQASFPHCALNEEGLPETSAVIRSIAARPAARSETLRCLHIERSGGLRWRVRRSMVSPQLKAILVAPDQFLEQAKVLKPSRSSAVSAAGGLVLKRYNYRKWTSRFKDGFRASRGTRGFLKAYLLESAGVPTARPVAVADLRRWGLLVRSYLVMEEISGAVSLESWSGDKRAAAKQLAELLARLHGEGFIHRDLKGANVLFDENGQPHLIDLDGLHFVRETSAARAVADLARLARDMDHWHCRPSRSDRLRFVVAYCRARRLRDWCWWWHAIDQVLPMKEQRLRKARLRRTS